MLRRLFSTRRDLDRAAHDLYGTVVAMARDPVFYRDCGVPDDMPGRLEMMIMHIYLLTSRLKDSGPRPKAFSQQLFDLFLEDMDRGMREAGVGDVTVPKRIKRITRNFYGRARAYDDVLGVAGGDVSHQAQALQDIVDRNLFAGVSERRRTTGLGEYMMKQRYTLAAATYEELIEGTAGFLAVDEAMPACGNSGE